MRRRKPTRLGLIGTATGGAGVIGLAWGNINDFNPDRIGVVLLLLGAILICYQRLNTKNLAADEIYNVGRERGEADGYEQGYQDGLQDTQRPRPTVLQLHPKCEDCGRPAVRQSVGSVADRG